MNPDPETTALEALAGWMGESAHTVFLTGPELGLECGIPDAGELAFNPDINDFKENEETKREYWAKLSELYPKIAAALPGEAHRAIYEMSLVCGGIEWIITQAVDGLHAKAGSGNVLELYASIHWAQCLSCGKDYRMMDVLTSMSRENRTVPRCAVCRAGILKPPLSFPGQPLPHWEIREGWIKVHGCDLLVCAGASLDKEPVASFPVQARAKGAKTAVISASPGPADDYVDAVIYGGAGVVMTRLLEELKKKMSVS